MPPYLAVGGDRQSRSKSPGGRERSRSRSNVRDERESERRGSSQRKPSKQLSESESESSEEEDPRYRNRRSSKQLYDPPSDDDYRRGRGKPATPKSSTKSLPAYAPVPPPAAQYAQPTAQARPQPPGAFHQDMPVRHMSYTGHDPRYAPPPANSFIQPQPEPRQRAASNAGPQYANVGEFKYAQVDPTMAYKYNDRPQVSQPETRSKPQYVDVHPDQFEPKSRDKKYNDDKYEIRDRDSGRKERKMYDDDYSNDKKYREDKYEKRESIVEPEEKSRRPSRLSMSGGAGLGAGLGAATLGVAGHAMNSHGGKPPASPLLEAYKGTYQSISPMPSALVLAAHPDDSDLSDFGGLESDSDSDISDSDPNAKLKRKIRMLEKEKEMNRHDPRGKDHGEIVNPKGHQPGRHKAMIEIGERDHREVIEYDRHRPGGPGRAMIETREPDDEIDVMRVTVGKHGPVRSPIGPKKVKFYEPANDAKEIAAALKGTHRAANVKPLIKILPGLTVNEMDALKTEYKKHAKHDGVGINMSRHIKLRIPGYVGKAAYACSLGQWESESFWANCYYQTGASRRELLIESLMGRTNQQIREIKNFFKDKKYDDDLEKCMKTELKADKFRVAILLALQEERMSESAPLQGRLVRQDVQDLHEALTSAGGETAMISIIVIRSDAHLREVLREYERLYGRNFARDMISKSKNLVGETLAHILNGALNRPMRDALLLHQAIAETAPGKERAELLISRLIRLHWEPKHFEKVKEQYAKRYGVKVNEAIKKEIQKGMKTEEGIAWTNFCIELVKSSEA